MATIIVKAKSIAGRYRVGRHFAREATELDTTEITAEQLLALQADPELIVTLPAETDARRAKREKKELAEAQAAAKKADDEALAREKAAIKTKEGKAAWEAAAVLAAEGLTAEQFAALAPVDRIARIEAKLAT